MDTLDDKNMREEMPDVRSAAHDDPLVSGTQGSADVDIRTRSWLAQTLKHIRYWLKAASFSPEWLSAPWDHPVLGYIAAILIPVGAMMLTLLSLTQIYGELIGKDGPQEVVPDEIEVN